MTHAQPGLFDAWDDDLSADTTVPACTACGLVPVARISLTTLHRIGELGLCGAQIHALAQVRAAVRRSATHVQTYAIGRARELRVDPEALQDVIDTALADREAREDDDLSAIPTSKSRAAEAWADREEPTWLDR